VWIVFNTTNGFGFAGWRVGRRMSQAGVIGGASPADSASLASGLLIAFVP
jgi:hypothetical protein